MFYYQFQFLSNVEVVGLSVYTVSLVDIADFVEFSFLSFFSKSKKDLILCRVSVILPAVNLLFSTAEKGLQFAQNIKTVYIIIFV